MKNKSLVFACALSVTMVGFAAWDDDLPETFDATTGYVTHTQDDTFTTPAPSDTDFVRKRAWSDDLAPHGGTNYYSAKTLYTPFWVTNSTISFAAETLVVAGTFHMLCGSSISTAANLPSLVVSDLYVLGGATLSSWGQKNPLAGKLHIRRSSDTKPVKLSWDPTVQPLRSDLDGDENQCVSLLSQKTTTLTFWFQGDLSKYYGTYKIGKCTHLRLAGTADGTKARAIVGDTGRLSPLGDGNFALKGVTLESGATFQALSGSVSTFADLSLAAGATVEIGSNASGTNCGKLVVTNSFAASGLVTLTIPSFSDVNVFETKDIELIRFAPTVEMTDVALEKFAYVEASSQFHTTLTLRDDTDGGKTLVLRAGKVVKHANAASSSAADNDFTHATNASNQALWEDGLCPATNPEAATTAYYDANKNLYLPEDESAAIYVFPGRSLSLGASGAFRCFAPLAGWRGDLYVNNAGYTFGSAAGHHYSEYKMLDGTTLLKTFKFQGTLHLVGSFSACNYGNTQLTRIESEIVGAGDLSLTTYGPKASSWTIHGGNHELTAFNTNWTGKVTMSVGYLDYTDTAGGCIVPNNDYCVRLYVSDSRNLGGACASYKADALKIQHYSLLIARNSLTLEDGVNRGIAIGDIGRIHVPSGMRMNIARPVTLGGQLVKEGPGALALGGTLAFYQGTTIMTDPVAANSNLVTVAGGQLLATSKAGLDGAGITVTDGALAGDPDATGEAATYGIYNVKSGGFVRAGSSGEKIRATLLTPADFKLGQEFEAAFLTVPKSNGLTTESFQIVKPEKAKSYELTISSVEADDLVTFSIRAKPVGLFLMFR